MTYNGWYAKITKLNQAFTHLIKDGHTLYPNIQFNYLFMLWLQDLLQNE